MKYLILIILFTFNSLLQSQNSIFNTIKQEKVESTWTDKGDYLISNFKANPTGIARDYGNMIFYKFRVYAIFIDKENGNVFQEMWQSINGQRNENGYPFNLYRDNWDISPSDTSNIILGEYSIYTGDESRIISFKNGISDTLFKWINKEDGVFPNQRGIYYFYAINDNEFLIQYDEHYIDHPIELDLRRGFYFNKKNKYFGGYKFDRMNLDNIIFNGAKNKFLTKTEPKDTDYEPQQQYQQNSYDFFSLNNDTCKFDYYIDMGKGKTFADFIQDSLCIYERNDTLYLYNLNSKSQLATYFIDNNPYIRGIYYDENSNVANIISSSQRGKVLYSIHIPTKKTVLDKVVDAPYLGKPITELKDGYQLSIGDGNYLYKHKNELFKYDSIDVDFNYKNTTNNLVEFEDASFGAIVQWQWDFGDGEQSNESNPNHQYSKSGDFLVKLHVIDAFGNEKTTSKTITVEDKLNSSFEFGKFSGNVPLSIDFQNYSTPNAIKYIWNFGDGTYSYEKEPTHIFVVPGTYTVSLTVFDKDGNFNTFLSAKKVVAN